MKKIIFCLFFVVNCVVMAHSQSIKGKLVDLVDNKPLAGATLTLVSLKDTTQTRRSLADSSGSFSFQNLPIDSFFVKVGFIGYEEYKQIVATNDSVPVVNLGVLYIPKSTKSLTDVTVTARVAPVQQKGDTTQFNASQFKVNPDATTEDLIKKMPGITVDKDGTVTAQGEQVKKVTIDGREFFGDDATAALRNLPSEIVDKIQVFDRLSDQAQFTGFDDGNSQKAINVVTKAGLKNGQFGRMYAGYGTDSRYSGGGNVSFFKKDRRLSFVGNFNNINQQNFASQDLLGVTSSGGGGGNFGGGGGNRGGGQQGGGGPRGGGGGGGGNFGGGGGQNFSVGQQSGISKTNAIGINFSDKWGKKLDIQSSYFFNNSNNTNDNSSRTEIISDTIVTNQISRSQSKNYNHRLNLRLEYRIDAKNSFIINPSLNFQDNTSLSQSFESSLQGTDSLNKSSTNKEVTRKGFNIRNNILYRHSFAKQGRTFSVNTNTTFNKNDGETYTLGDYRFFKTNTTYTDSAQNQFSDNPTNGYNLSANMSYTEPITAKSQLQISYSPSYSKNTADQQTFSYDTAKGVYSTFITALSNKFDNTTTTHNAGITYRIGNTRENQFSIGVNLQHSKLESDRTFPDVSSVNQTFSNVLPSLQWRKKVSPRSSINFFYRANTQFPSVTQLQDVVNNTNELRKSVGNPDLKQSYSHFLSGRYTFTNTQKGQAFFANVFLQAQQNYISNATYIAANDSIIDGGNKLARGSQLSKPINLDGYKNFRSFFTFSQPVKFIKSNINLSTGFTYSTLPAVINYEKTMTDNYTFNTGLVIASNVSEYVDFNISYNANFSSAKTDGVTDNYFNQSTGIQFNLLSKSGWFLQNDLSNQKNSGYGEGFNQSFWLWNAGIGKKFLKKKQAELKLSVFDLLKQNQSISRTVSGGVIEDSRSTVLQQYFMLTFTYSLKNFGTPAVQQSRGGGNFPGGGGFPGGGQRMNF